MTSRLLLLRVLVLMALLLAAVPRACAQPIQWNYLGQIETTGPAVSIPDPATSLFAPSTHHKVSIDPFTFSYNQVVTSSTQYPIISPYQNVPIHVQVSDLPEPSALALAAAGLAGLGLRAWRRRRRR
jgi:PEP-CTERM motif